MNNQQAIKILKEEKSWESNDRKIDAFNMAIEALEKQITIREEIEAWCWKHEQYSQDDLNELMDIVNQLVETLN